MTASARSTQPGGDQGAGRGRAGGGQRGHGRKFPEVVALFRSPARDPVRSARPPCPGEEVGVGLLSGEAPRDRERLHSPPLCSRLAFPERRGDWTCTKEEEEGLGSPAPPFPGGYRSGPEPRRQSPGTYPRGTGPHQDYKTVRKTNPPKKRLVAMWGLLIWTLLALHQIRAAGAQGTVPPPVGLGKGRGSSLASRSPPGPQAWPGQSPLPGVSGPFPRVWGLSLGGWSGLAETCGFRIREGGGPCREASLVEAKRSRGGGGRYPPTRAECPRSGVGGARHSVPGSAPGCTQLLRPGSWVPARCPRGRARPCRARAGPPRGEAVGREGGGKEPE